LRTFSGNFTNKDLRDDPAKQAADRQLRQLTSGIAQSQVGDLQKQFQETGQRPDMAQLNQLEQLGANTFGTGMRGRFDYAGSGQQPISRSQVGQFRNTFNDPSLQVFDRKTGMNPIGLGIGDYANYYQGREDRLAKTPLGGIMNTISDFGDKAMQYSPLNYIVPQSFRTTPPNRQIPSALQEELEGTKLPPNVSFTPPSGLASIKIPSLADLLSNLDFGAQKNKNQDDLTMDKMITAKGMQDGGYMGGAQDVLSKELEEVKRMGEEFGEGVYGGRSTFFLNALGQVRRVNGAAQMKEAIEDGYIYTSEDAKEMNLPSPPKILNEDRTTRKVFKRSNNILDAFGDPLGGLADAEKEALAYIENIQASNKLNPNYDPVVSSSSGLGAFVIPRSQTADSFLDRLMGGLDIVVKYDPERDEMLPKPKPKR